MANPRESVRQPVSQATRNRAGSSVPQRTTSIFVEDGNEVLGSRPTWGQRFGALWTTRQIAEFQPREVEVRITIREMIIYFIFLGIVMIVGLGMVTSTMYYYSKVISDLFVKMEFSVDDRTVSFETSTQMADFWAYAENVMVDAFYWDFWYDKKNSIAPTTKEDKNILYENKVLGVPRLRQVKVRKNSCSISEDFRRSFSSCYDVYSESAEETEPFGIKTGSAWTYFSEDELGGYSHWGSLATYGGGGYYQDLSSDRNASFEVLEKLKENLWLDRGTRAVFIDFTTYNANINLFCVAKLVFEFPPTGGVITSWSLKTVKLIRYVTIFDFFVLACEYMFVVFTLYYTAEEVREIIYFKTRYFKVLWNYVDLTILGLSYTCIVFNVYRSQVVKNQLHTLIDRENIFEDFTSIAFWQVQFNNAIAIIVFFCWIKVFKYISFNRTMAQLNNTLSRCVYDICGFGIMFFIVFCAFAQLGFLLFGTQVEGFSSFGNSVFTLLRTILGDFDYQSIEQANRILGPIFFLSYIFFVFFVLLNMFLAIINDTYSEVKSEISVRRNEFEMADFLYRGYLNLLRKCGVQKKAKDTEGLTYDDIRNLLRRSNFTDMEIEMFFAKYDIDKNKPIGEEETKRMLEDLEGQRRGGAASSSAEPNVTLDDLNLLETRVSDIEKSIGIIVDKVDLIIKKLEARMKT